MGLNNGKTTTMNSLRLESGCLGIVCMKLEWAVVVVVVVGGGGYVIPVVVGFMQGLE